MSDVANVRTILEKISVCPYLTFWNYFLNFIGKEPVWRLKNFTK